MKNRIRLYRRQRNLTLKQLADAVGTTPQTISRLETEVMTLSTDWLSRLGDVLGVHPTDLLDSPERPNIPMLGVLSGQGMLSKAGDAEHFAFDIAAERPVAVKLGQAYGPYREGEVLIGTRVEGADLENILGRDALCCLPDGRLMLRRAIRGNDNTFTLVPLNPDASVNYNQPLRWAARIVLRLQYV